MIISTSSVMGLVLKFDTAKNVMESWVLGRGLEQEPDSVFLAELRLFV